jgi:hypothetical protein
MEINVDCNETSKESIKEISNHPSSMKFIRCPECGEAMLMVSTLGQMIEVIENHLISHRKHPNNEGTLVHIKTPTIRMDLTHQVLIQASDDELSTRTFALNIPHTTTNR